MTRIRVEKDRLLELGDLVVHFVLLDVGLESAEIVDRTHRRVLERLHDAVACQILRQDARHPFHSSLRHDVI